MDFAAVVQIGLLWGLVFGGVFSAAMMLIGRINAEMILNDYPPDIRAKYGPMSERTRRQANLASLPLVAVLSAIIILALAQLRQQVGELTLLPTLALTTIIYQVWNLIDLVVLDWFLLMTLKPRFMILPGTENLAGYRDYAFHFRKFLNGIVFTFVLAVITSGVALLVELLI